jgi:hypothetical protein
MTKLPSIHTRKKNKMEKNTTAAPIGAGRGISAVRRVLLFG